MSTDYAIINGWLVETSAECTCSGLPYGHQPECGAEPIAKVEDLLNDSRQLQEFAERAEEAERAVRRVSEWVDEAEGRAWPNVMMALRIFMGIREALAEPPKHSTWNPYCEQGCCL